MSGASINLVASRLAGHNKAITLLSLSVGRAIPIWEGTAFSPSVYWGSLGWLWSFMLLLRL